MAERKIDNHFTPIDMIHIELFFAKDDEIPPNVIQNHEGRFFINVYDIPKEIKMLNTIEQWDSLYKNIQQKYPKEIAVLDEIKEPPHNMTLDTISMLQELMLRVDTDDSDTLLQIYSMIKNGYNS